MSTETATLSDGRTIQYIPEVIGSGVMKQVYFTADRQSVVCFYINQQDPFRLARLKAVVDKFNPTLDRVTGDYWKKRFCWPSAVIEKPRLGILAPAYPRNYYFKKGAQANKEKQGNWFSGTSGGGTPLRKLIDESERGTWINYFGVCVNLARAVRRLHAAGLAHSDLSAKNVLIDPTAGELCITDIDSLVVPPFFPPDVMGTRTYIAPEVVATQHLDIKDPKRHHPCAATDRHAMAVLIYEYLLSRNPLKGPRTFPASSGEDQDKMEWGAGALFVEHPADTSNRPPNLKVGCAALGPALHKLFEGAFVAGLHNARLRPSAQDWERELVYTWGLVTPCVNAACEQKHFVLADPKRPVCPFCGTKLKSPVIVLDFKYERSPGVWHTEWELVVSEVHGVMRWHVERGIFPDERADRTIQAHFERNGAKWLLVNDKLPLLMTAAGNRVLPGYKMELSPGAVIRLSPDARTRVVEVRQIL
jgi:hypothetical protein